MAEDDPDRRGPGPGAVTPGALARRMLAEAARCSEPGPGVTRLPFTLEHRAVLGLIRGWMEQAGLAVRPDDAGTLIGRAEGAREGPVLLLGSHQDSVRQGGAYDGMLGVAVPIAALATLAARGERPAGPVEVLVFADEEGVRWPTALMGPRALAGTFDAGALEMTDRDGIALGAAMRAFGLAPEAIPGLRRRGEEVRGYVEVHIEQGPVLEAMGRPLGVVTAICGIERHAVRIEGQAAHAGTVPMELRRDALAGAAEFVLAAERRARETEGLLATVGALSVEPGVVNAVPGAVDCTLEVRAPRDPMREAAGRELAETAKRLAAERGLVVSVERTYSQPAQPCDAALTGQLAAAAGEDTPALASGATHDASAMADLCPVAMLFVRCRGGISHHPDEHVEPEDIDAATAAVLRLLAST